MLTARVEAARWSEGRAAAGTIATALRAYIIEKAELEEDGALNIGEITIDDFMSPADLTGKYFTFSDYELDVTGYDPSAGEDGYIVTYLITVNPGTGPSATSDMWTKGPYTLDHRGIWTDTSNQ